MELISGASLLGFPQLVSELGADPGGVLAAAGLRVDDCGRAEAFLPLRYAIQAVERASVHTQTADFGRRLADRQGIEILGPVGLAARTAADVGRALEIFDKFMAAYSPGIAVPLETCRDPDIVFLAWRVTLDPPFACPQTAELSLGIALRVLRLMLGPDYRPVTVHIPHPPLTPERDYLHYYGCQALFAEPVAGFTMYASELNRPLADGNDLAVHDEAMTCLTGAIGDRTGAATRSVAALVGSLLPSGHVTVALIARQLGVHPKALQRRLAGEGTSFSDVIDQVRREIAQRCLRDTDIGLAHLALQLGFAEQSVLTRACRRWFGASPSAHRLALRRTL